MRTHHGVAACRADLRFTDWALMDGFEPWYGSTLVEILRRRAEGQPDQRAYTFLAEGEHESGHLTYAQLDRQARAIAHQLRQLAAPGDRVLLIYHQSLEFISAFFGCLYAGLVAVPTPLPDGSRLERTIRRVQVIVDDARASVLLSTAELFPMFEALSARTGDLRSAARVASDRIDLALADDWRPTSIAPRALAYLQYTSGSTSNPKGVMVTHGNLMSNSLGIRLASDYGPDCTTVSWLPYFHDYGLIEGILQPLYSGFPCYLMAPHAFVQRPVRWLRAISKYRGTHAQAPSFAYALCTARVSDEQLATLDLGTWRAAGNGSEPVRPESIEQFAAKFAARGFRHAAFCPEYGLAEGTLIATCKPAGTDVVSVVVDAEALDRRHRAESPRPDRPSKTVVSCGRALQNVTVAVVDPESRLRVADQVVGEIWLGGPSLALGYWEKPVDTEQTFRGFLADTSEGPFLRTGDLGFLAAGELYVTGRIKDLVIINGVNHYPQDIESTVEQCHPLIRAGCSTVFSAELDGEERLVIVAETSAAADEAPALFDAVREAVAAGHDLETYAIVLLATGSMRKTTSGKVQRSACRRDLLENSPDLGVIVARWQVGQVISIPSTVPAGCGLPPIVPNTAGEIQAWLCGRIAAHFQVPVEQIDVRQPFRRFGLGSREVVGLTGELEERLHRSLSPTIFFDFPNIATLSAHLAGQPRTNLLAAQACVENETTSARYPEGAVAIVGLAARLPDANNVDEFWRNLCQGRSSIREVPADRWAINGFYDERPGAAGRSISKWGGFLDGVDQFDPLFFGISPYEAVRMDPQQRLVLEVAWEALESAGLCGHDSLRATTGVFIGASGSDYLQQLLASPDQVDAFTCTGNFPSIVANRLSYFLDLHGPSLAVDTACSSSLTAVHLALQSLRAGECQMALVGGVQLLLAPQLWIGLSKAGMLSPDGVCKTFDDRANGYVRGEGAGVVVLRPLADAIRDRNTIHAVILNSAVNQDGHTNGLTAPSGRSQTELLKSAYDKLGVPLDALGYLEAHGTGTSLGDPIELEALSRYFNHSLPAQSCAMGSVKTNIGHLEPAAGIAGLIKAALALRHETLPPTLHVEHPNRFFRFEQSPFYVNDRLRAWPASGDRVRYAGVSSFGFGGTNAHVVLAGPPAPAVATAAADPAGHLFVLSARGRSALAELAGRFGEHLEQGIDSANSLADICYTTVAGRAHFRHRLALVATDRDALALALRDFAAGRPVAGLLYHEVAENGDAGTSSNPTVAAADNRLATLDRQAQAYVSGGRIDFDALDPNRQRRLVPLPTYPFEHKRYWLESHAPTASLSATTEASPVRGHPWFHHVRWQPTLHHGVRELPRGAWLIVGDPHNLGQQLAQRLAIHGARAVIIDPGFAPVAPEKYAQAFQNAGIQTSDLTGVLYLHPLASNSELGGTSDPVNLDETRDLFVLLQTVAKATAHTLELVVFTQGAAAVADRETVSPSRAALAGLCRVAANEHHHLRMRLVDLAATEPDAVSRMLAELQLASVSAEAAYRDSRRWEPELRPASAAAVSNLPETHSDGLYVISGGLGALGFEVARWLATHGCPRLALIGRTPLPPERDWPEYLALPGADASLAEKLARIQTLRQLGATVIPVAADIANIEITRRALAALRTQYGPIRGVVHTAGVLRDGLLINKPLADFDEVLSTKARGAAVLDRLTLDDPLDFFVLFSSVNGLFGIPGQCDYAAANAFSDALAQQRHAAGRPALSLGWPAWSHSGMSARRLKSGAVADNGLLVLEPRIGIELFAESLGRPEPHLVPFRYESAAPSQRPQPFTRAWPWDTTGTHSTAPASEVDAAGRDAARTDADLKHRIRIRLSQAISQALGVTPEQLRPATNFMELGVNSILGSRIIVDLQEQLGVTLPPTLLFSYPNLNSLIEYFIRFHPRCWTATNDGPMSVEPAQVVTGPVIAPPPRPGVESRTILVGDNASAQFAIIGMALRFPGANSPEQFWQLLCEGQDQVGRPTAETGQALRGPGVERYPGGYLRGIDQFDAAFFGISPHEARLLDPQQRLFLEVAWEALERSGHAPLPSATRRAGVFVGVSTSDYMRLWERSTAAIQPHFGSGTSLAMIPNRVSYLLNLRGPSQAIDTACSSSLVALHTACRSLAAGECDLGIVGGVNLILVPDTSQALTDAGMLSPTGRCRTFDDRADGYVRGEGVAALIVKRLDDALVSGDQILAVVKATALNHDGHDKAGLTAPSRSAQRELLEQALRQAHVSPASIGYVEAHGTGTSLGDPIELEALTEVYGRDCHLAACAIGSVKSNLGHLEAAAGIAGVIKAVLALEHRALPPTLHCAAPNSRFDWNGSPFYISDRVHAWTGEGPRRAAVSSFGFGGANCHAILEEAVGATEYRSPSQPAHTQLFTLSARTEPALRQLVEAYHARLNDLASAELADLCYTANTGRVAWEHRVAIVARYRDQLCDRVRLLRQWEDRDQLQGSFVFHGVVTGDEPTHDQLQRVQALLNRLSATALRKLGDCVAGDWFDRRIRPLLNVAAELSGDPIDPTSEDYTQLLACLGLLFSLGAQVEWSQLYTDRSARRVLLPTYPFQHETYWLDVAANETSRRPAATPAQDRPVQAVAEATVGMQSAVLTRLIHEFASVLEIPISKIDPRRPVVEQGMDSILAMRLAQRVSELAGRSLPPTIFYDYGTLQRLASALVQEFGVEPGKFRAVALYSSATSKTLATLDRLHGKPVHRTEGRATGISVAGHRHPDPLSEEEGVLPGELTAGAQHHPHRAEPIAIIGAAARLPGSPTLAEFWQHLAAGDNLVQEVPPDRWDVARHYSPDRHARGKSYSKWAGLLAGYDEFDAAAFGISPREAEQMDPQQRLLLEVAWETLESAGYAGERVDDNVGVFVGAMTSEYLPNLLSQPDGPDTYAATGNAMSMIANRLSYRLGLTGPSLALDTACSSSLVAIHLAVESLRRGECSVALVGGTQVGLSLAHFEMLSRINALSPTGRCQTFADGADGYVLGEGVGLVLLKPLCEAIRDRDNLLGVILATAMNHGGESAGLTVPNPCSQATLIRRALDDADCPPETISYIEAHGTGTALGDPIELDGLRRAFAGTAQRQFCALGSVKSNVGHLEPAAGIAGLLKVLLAMRARQLPPSLHVSEPNRAIRMEDSPFYVVDRLTDWTVPANQKRRAGVSSFGFGGTNAHVVLEEPPAAAPVMNHSERPAHLLVLSARTDSALKQLARRYAAQLDLHPQINLADLCYTAAIGRAQLGRRLALVVGGRLETGGWREEGERLRQALSRHARDASASDPTSRLQPPASSLFPGVAILFTGQGAQYPGMGRELYETSPTFRHSIDRCANILANELDVPLSELLFSTSGTRLNQTQYTQPALFALEYALFELWQSYGLAPQWLLGHSLGEYVAATAAGVMTLEQGLTLVARRARLMQALPAGSGMAAVLAGVDAVRFVLGDFGTATERTLPHANPLSEEEGGRENVLASTASSLEPAASLLSIAAINSPHNTVLAGPQKELATAMQRLRDAGHAVVPLPVSHAFHSAAIEPMLASYLRELEAINWQPARTALVLNQTGTVLEVGQTLSPEYWLRQARNTVLFQAGVEKLANLGARVFVEVGPGGTLVNLSRQTLEAVGKEEDGATSSLPPASSLQPSPVFLTSLGSKTDTDWHTLLTSTGQLYVQGVPLDLAGIDHDYQRRRIELPTYPFERKRYWISAAVKRSDDSGHESFPPSPAGRGRGEGEAESSGMAEPSSLSPLTTYLHELCWQPREITPLLPPRSETGSFDFHPLPLGEGRGEGAPHAGSPTSQETWLLVGAPQPVVEQFRKMIQRGRLISVGFSGPFAGVRDDSATMDPSSPAQWRQLIDAASNFEAPLAHVVHCFVSTNALGSQTNDPILQFQTALQALAGSLDQSIDYTVVTCGAQTIHGHEASAPGLAAVWGFARTAAREFSRIRVQLIDSDRDTLHRSTGISQLFTELRSINRSPQVAYRAGQRFVPGIARTADPASVRQYPLLQPGGVYLITGGLGGLGLVFAEHLTSTDRPRLILCGRSPVTNESSADKRKDLDRLRALGATVEYIAGDIGNPADVRRLIETIRARHGRISGIIHAAGQTADRLIVHSTPDDLDAVFRPKVLGAQLLAEATSDEPLDFVIGVSSLAGLAGNVGQAAYAAANAALDSVLESQFAHAATRMSLCFGPWQELGVSADPALVRKWQSLGIVPISKAVGRDLFAWTLAHPRPRWVLFRSLSGDIARQPDGFTPLWQVGRTETVSKVGTPVTTANALGSGEPPARLLLIDVISQVLRCAREEVQLDRPFREQGIDSLLADEIVRRLRPYLPGADLGVATLFEFPTVRSLAQSLAPFVVSESRPMASLPAPVVNAEAASRPLPQPATARSQDVAVIGYACQFPGGNDAEGYWRLLASGASAVGAIPAERWRIARDYDPALAASLDQARLVGGFLPDIDRFDPLFFRISPVEADQIDPRQRLFLKVAYHAAEQAGYGGQALWNTSTGVFVGSGAEDYFSGVAPGSFAEHAAVGGTASSLPSRLAYFLNLHGPALTIDTACSSSLFALHAAVRSLRGGECDFAFAAGVHLNLRLTAYWAMSRTGALSPTGKCSPWDRRADGFVPGEGVAVLLLRPLAAAIAAGDTIHGVIRGTATNHGGSANGLTAPNPRSQFELLRAAWNDADINPEQLSYIETHGTGTALGDPVEIGALAKAFAARTSRRQFCAIGGTKPNIGHTDAAAGIAGVVKVLLSYQHDQIPASINIVEPNPRLTLEDTALVIADRPRPWSSAGDTRLAGVSSFGFSGANAHALVAHGPRQPARTELVTGIPQLFTLSARTEASLRQLIEDYRAVLADKSHAIDLGDICYTAAIGRFHLRYRVAIVAQDIASLTAQLNRLASSESPSASRLSTQQVHETLTQLLPSQIQLLANCCAGDAVDTLVRPVLPESRTCDPSSITHDEPLTEPFLSMLGSLYVRGAEVDWNAIYQAGPYRRIPLPLYPYDQQRYWLESTEVARGKRDEEAAALPPSPSGRGQGEGAAEKNRKARDRRTAEPIAPRLEPTPSASWFYEPRWTEWIDPVTSGRDLSGAWLIFHGPNQLASPLADQLRSAGGTVIEVRSGVHFAKTDATRFEIDRTRPADYQRLLSELPPLRGIVHLGGCPTTEPLTADLEGSLDQGVRSVALLAQAAAANRTTAELWIITSGTQAVRQDRECTHPQHAALWGLAAAARRELPNLTFRCVDLESTDRDARHLVELLRSAAAPAALAIRAGRYFVCTYPAVRDLAQPSRSILKRNGVYLITGGLGGIGQRLADWLRERYQANIILCGRSATDDERDGIVVRQADVTDAASMRRVVADAKQRFGHFDGVFHAAGVIRKGLLKDESLADFNDVLRPKVSGAHVLTQLLAEESLDCLVFFSSVAAVTGNVFQADYSAANRALDSYAAFARVRGIPAWSINWGEWVGTGMAQGMDQLSHRRGQFGLTAGEALAALELVLSIPARQWIISRSDLHQESPQTVATLPHQSAPRRVSASTDSVEARLATAVRECLRLPPGDLDNQSPFLNLGMDSMLATHFMKSLSTAVGRRLSPTLPFDYPNLALLAEHLAGLLTSDELGRWLSGDRHDSNGKNGRTDGMGCPSYDPPPTDGLKLRSGRRVFPVVR